ncbi:MAG: VOC family protein [Rubrobacter sp.]|nr:VOC family protein [Rubrobacter sp.]
MAIADDSQHNVDFYVGLLALQLVKKTVNFDDPETYHLYLRCRDGQSRERHGVLPLGGREGRDGACVRKGETLCESARTWTR